LTLKTDTFSNTALSPKKDTFDNNVHLLGFWFFITANPKK